MPLDPAIVLGALFFSIVLNVTLAHRLFSKRRRRANSECVKCGYDIRQNIGRCPECGEPIPKTSPAREPTRCSFCGRPSTLVGRMIEGPGDVFICLLCTDWSAEAVADLRAKGELPPRATSDAKK